MRKFIYYILISLNLVLAFALLLSYLSTYISPARIWPLAFIGLVYPYLLIANVVFLVLWVFKLKPAAFISLIVIILGWNHMVDYIPFRLPFFREKPLRNMDDHREFRILSYNVRAFNIFEWLEGRSTSNNIFNLVKSEKPDIICMQEYYTGDLLQVSPDLELILKDNPYSHVYYAYTTGGRNGYGIATFSKYPIINKGIIRFKNTNNISIFSDIVVQLDTIRIYNNHLQSLNMMKSNYDFLDTLRVGFNEEQRKQYRDISRLLKNAFVKRSVQVDSVSYHIKNCTYPVIVCGDFNDTPVSYTYRKMRAGLKDSFVSSGGGLGNTYMGVFPYFRIDYIFHSSFFRTTHFERISAKLSDHYPIICQLSYLPGNIK